MTFASLFSGIGGAEIAAMGVGWEPKFWCEIEPFCQQVLRYWFKDSIGYGDITKTDFSCWRGKIDVLHGSSPCQAVSVCGKRKGDTDDRWLWKEMLRAIREIKPGWVSFENVAGLRSMVSSAPSPGMEGGQCDDGEVHEGLLYGIIEDLEREGYEVQTYLIPACSVGAPHERKRIWIVAHRTDARAKTVREQENKIYGSDDASDADCSGCRSGSGDREEGFIYTQFEWELAEGERKRDERQCKRCKDGGSEPSSDSSCERVQGMCISGVSEKEGREDEDGRHKEPSGNDWGVFFNERWRGFPSKPPVCRGDDGIPFRLDSLAVPFRKWRNETIKAYGNALVPQVLYQIFKCINEVENGTVCQD